MHRRSRRFQPQVRAIPVHAGVIGEAVGVPAEINLVVRLVEIPKAGNHFRVVVPFEAGPRRNVKYSIRAIAEIRGITAPLRFHRIYILGIDLRPEIAGDIRVGDRHSIDQPAYLVPAAHVQLIVRTYAPGT